MKSKPKKAAKKRNPMKPSTAVAVHAPTCGARTRGTGVCRNQPGFKTDHLGQGKCYLHGGATPIKHGRYSSIQRQELRVLIEHHEADPNPLDILPELAAARALFQNFIERYDAWRDALIAWHQSYKATARPISEERILHIASVLTEFEIVIRDADELTDKQADDLKAARETLNTMAEASSDGKPTQILDIADAYRIVSEVTKIAERIERIRAANAVSRGDLMRIMTEMGRVVQAQVSEETTLQKIKDGWLAIRL